MASIANELATLRALTFRISSTPASQLPQHVPAISACLINCRAILSTAQPASSKATSPEWVLSVHKYRTVLSTLLQQRTIQERWAAIVLIKVTIEVGGWETLQKCLPWVRGLLGILTKPDPPSSKKLCIITLTRIFLLTKEYPTLVREITTPSLPTFIQSSLQILKPSAPPGLVQIVLESFHGLLPKHPNIFRSYLKQLSPLLAHLIAATPSSKPSEEKTPGRTFVHTAQITHVARQLYVQTSCCAPKGAPGEEWTKSMQSTINDAHRVADKVFRAVLEDWRPATRDELVATSHIFDDEMQDQEEGDMKLPSWSGIFAGSERLTGLLQLLKEHLESPTASAVLVNLAAIMDLIARILSINVPALDGKNSQHVVRLNNQISKDERENLWLLLPGIHVAATEVLLALMKRSQASSSTLDSIIIDQLLWVFGSEKKVVQIRAVCYVLIATLLKRSGTALSKPIIDSLVPLIKACCDDLLPSEASNSSAKQTSAQTNANGTGQSHAITHADTFLIAMKTDNDPATGLHGLKEAASSLLPALLTHIRAQNLSDSVRTRLERTAVLIQHKDAMIASVLNPPPSKKFGKPAASILPLSARSFPQEKVVEAILRPRMPVIRLGNQGVEDADEIESDVEENGISEATEELNKEDDDFVGQALETLLSTEQTDNVIQEIAVRNVSAIVADAFAPERNEGGTATTSHPISESMDTSKRTLDDHVLPLPSKRMKRSDDEQSTLDYMLPDSTSTASLKDVSVNDSLFPAPEIEASNIASMAPKLTNVGTGDVDSDDDDIGPLVLGPDTDQESE